MFVENNYNTAKNSGWIEVITGSMFSGKTEELIRRLKRAQIARQNTGLFKPIIEKRYSEKDVVTHNYNSMESVPVKDAREIIRLTQRIDVIGIDEVQFFGHDLPDVCNELANNGKRVIAAGLDMNYKAEPFSVMPQLLAIAEYITKVHAICIKCGSLANYSHRFVDDDDYLIGGKDSYQPLCRHCYQNEQNH